MTAQVLPFKQRPVTGTRPSPIEGPKYFCRGCDQSHFFLMADKTIYCANCKRMSMNVTVNDVNNP